MPRFFCDYCDSYLTHDSAPGRQQHCRGWKHRENFKNYYNQYYPLFIARQQQALHAQQVQGMAPGGFQQSMFGMPGGPGMHPPGMMMPPPGQFPPGQFPPPGMMMPPPGQMMMPPPGQFPPGQFPPGQFPPPGMMMMPPQGQYSQQDMTQSATESSYNGGDGNNQNSL